MRRKPSTTTRSGWTCTSASSSTAPSTDPSRHMKNTGSVRLHLCAAAFAALWVLGCTAQTVIYEKASPYNTIIVTEDHKGLRTLLFERGGGRQSVVKPGDPDHLELPYARTALAGLALCEEPRRMLVVGLGGGSLPMFLRAHYPAATIDVAEIDPDVVEVAKRFFGFREDERMRSHVGDGRQFIEDARQADYDLIFLDAFGARDVPKHLTTREFLQATRRALKPDGVVVSNVWRPASTTLFTTRWRAPTRRRSRNCSSSTSPATSTTSFSPCPACNRSAKASWRCSRGKYRPRSASVSTWGSWSSTDSSTRARKTRG